MEPYWYKATVVEVIDGDTVDIEIDLGFGIFFCERLRLYGINTPEVRGVEREEGLKAKAYVESAILNREVLINTIKDRKDKYGRYLAIIYIDETNLNEELLKNGLAETVNFK